jgi:hypothetical protein
LWLVGNGVDPGAAEEAVGVGVVTDDGLARGDGEDGGVEADGEFVGAGHEGDGWRGWGVVADFGQDAEGFLRADRESRAGEPINLAGGEGAVKEGGAWGEGDGVLDGVDGGNVGGLAQGEAGAFALADSEVLVAGMLAQDAAFGVDEVAGAEGVGGAGLEESGVVVVGDEADFLGVGLVVDGEAELMGELADVGFFEVTQGEEHAGEFVAGDAEEDVGLVFFEVAGAEEVRLAGLGVVGDAGVVAGGDEVRADGTGVAGEFAELEVFVAADAGVGGSAGIVLGDEVVDDLVEIGLEIEGVEGDVEEAGDEAGVGGVGGGAAADVLVRGARG